MTVVYYHIPLHPVFQTIVYFGVMVIGAFLIGYVSNFSLL